MKSRESHKLGGYQLNGIGERYWLLIYMRGAVLHCLLVSHLLCSSATMSQLLCIKAVNNTNDAQDGDAT